MIGIVFFLEMSHEGLNVASTDSVMDRREFDCRMLGATHLFMIDRTQYKSGQYYQHSSSEIEFERFDSIKELYQKYKEERFVFVENLPSLVKAEVEQYYDIAEYVHRKVCIYVFGPDSGLVNILEATEELNKEYVTIGGVENIYSHSAAVLTLYDRLTKTN